MRVNGISEKVDGYRYVGKEWKFELRQLAAPYKDKWMIVPNRKAIFSVVEGDEYYIDIKGDRYGYIDNRMAYDIFVEKILEGGYEIKNMAFDYTRDGSYFNMMANVGEEEVEIRDGYSDKYQYGFFMHNIVGGQGSITMGYQIYRLWCSNGAKILKESKTWKVRHVGAVDISVDRTMERLVNAVEDVFGKFKVLAEVVIPLEQLKVDLEEYVGKRKGKNIYEVLAYGDVQNNYVEKGNKRSLYDVYNAFTYWQTHMVKNPKNKYMLDSKMWGLMKKYGKEYGIEMEVIM